MRGQSFHFLEQAPAYTSEGRILSIQAQRITASLPAARVGDFCFIDLDQSRSLRAEVIGAHSGAASLTLLDPLRGLQVGQKVRNTRRPLMLQLPEDPFGFVFNAFGEHLPLGDAQPSPKQAEIMLEVFRNSPRPQERAPERERFFTGIRAIDSLCPLAEGQRMAILAGPGLGKSSLLAMIATRSDYDVLILGLIGERGREVKSFLEESLPALVRKKMIAIVATSDEAPAKRRFAAYSATRLAEHYRDKGRRVLLLIDSVTRVARAIREMSLDAGELPLRQGYTNSVFRELPELFERAGKTSCGSITAFYSLLATGKLEADPLSEELCSLLDGHLILSEELLQKGLRPAIDPILSLSRLQSQVCSPKELYLQNTIKQLYARAYREEHLRFLQIEKDPSLTHAIDVRNRLENFLRGNSSDGEREDKNLSHLESILATNE